MPMTKEEYEIHLTNLSSMVGRPGQFQVIDDAIRVLGDEQSRLTELECKEISTGIPMPQEDYEALLNDTVKKINEIKASGVVNTDDRSDGVRISSEKFKYEAKALDKIKESVNNYMVDYKASRAETGPSDDDPSSGFGRRL